MPRNIVNKPHPTPNPDKAHVPGPGEKSEDPSSTRRPTPAAYRPPGHAAPSDDVTADEEPNYDSCFDDLNVMLSQSIQQPDPDPNLESAGPSVRLTRDESAPLLQQDRGKDPRTSEIFRSVMAAALSVTERGDGPGASVDPSAPSQTSPECGTVPCPESGSPNPDLVVVDRGHDSQEPASEGEEPLNEPGITWSQVLLMSYASAITLALIWLLWTGRWSRSSAPSSTTSEPVVDSASRVVEPTPAPAVPLPIPPENRARIGQTIRLGDLEVTPRAIISTDVELVRSIEPRKRRREEQCLVLRLKLKNVSRDHTFAPLDPNLVRERDLRGYDPYIATSEGARIDLFRLALDSEWAIDGQVFTRLRPNHHVETFVVAEPGSAQNHAAEMTWRVRLRTGVYRTDMLGVPFSKDEVRPAGSWDRDIENEAP